MLLLAQIEAHTWCTRSHVVSLLSGFIMATFSIPSSHQPLTPWLFRFFMQRHDFIVSKSNLCADPHWAPCCSWRGRPPSFGHNLIDDSWWFNAISVQGNHPDKWSGKQGLRRHDGRVLEVSLLNFHSAGNTTTVSRFSVRHQQAAMLSNSQAFCFKLQILLCTEKSCFYENMPSVHLHFFSDLSIQTLSSDDQRLVLTDQITCWQNRQASMITH